MKPKTMISIIAVALSVVAIMFALSNQRPKETHKTPLSERIIVGNSRATATTFHNLDGDITASTSNIWVAIDEGTEMPKTLSIRCRYCGRTNVFGMY